MSRNIRNAAVAFSQQVLGALLGAVGMFFVARNMPQADFHIGIIGTALSFVGIFLALQRTFDAAHVKRVSEGEPLATCNGTYLVLNTLSTLTLVVLVLGATYAWDSLIPALRDDIAWIGARDLGGFQTRLDVRVIELLVAYQVLNSIGEYVRRTYEGQQNIVVGQVILTTEHVVKGAAMIYVAFHGFGPFLPGTHNALGIAGAYLVGAIALGIVAIGYMVEQPIGKPDWALARSYFSFGWKVTLTSSIYLIAVHATSIMLRLFWAPRDVGYYFAPARYVQFLPAVAGAVVTAVFPVFSKLHASGERSPELVARMVRLVSLLLLPIVALSVAMPEAIIHVLLSDQFLPAAPVLVILTVGGYVNAVRATIASKLGGMNKPEEVTKAAALSMVATLVLGIIFIAPSLFGVPLLGMRATGAALAVALAQFAGFGQVLRAAREHADVRFPPIWRHAIILAVTTGILYALTLVLPETSFRFYHLAGAGVLALALTGGVGLAVREISLQDVRTLWHFMHPSAWAEFFLEETGGRGR
ncbi:MAG: oligosaccharide flippase family protein [Candidatus Thermoplasmatota archaeon]|nr:oligosaccharide flippase family protein [Candidatus Thermoplasmatota archaeon]